MLKAFSLIFLLFFFHRAESQDKTQYLYGRIPQTISLNPAYQPACRNFLALPLLSDLQIYYRNNGFTFREAFTPGAGGDMDSLMINSQQLTRILGNRNHIRLGGEAGIVGLGFSKNDWAFSIFVTNRSAFRFTFTRSLIEARDGNWDLDSDRPRQLDLGGSGIYFTEYTELALGASRKIYEGFYAGVRLKLLLGHFNVQTTRSALQLNTTTSPIELYGYSDMMLRASLPVELMFGSDGLISGIDTPVKKAKDLWPYLFTGNPGAALDAGVIYRYSDQLTVSASMINLGFIRWRKQIHAVHQKEAFHFRGVELNQFVRSGTPTDILQALEDSIMDHFRLSDSESPYSALIPAQAFGAVEYRLNDFIRLGTIAEVEILSARLYPGLTFTGIATPRKGLELSLSYSLMDRAWNNLGFGMAIGNDDFNVYLMTDHVPFRYVSDSNSRAFWPYDSKTMNFRFGVNLFWGCEQERNPRYRKSGRNKYCPAYQ